MRLVYRYIAKPGTGEIFEGLVFASSEEEAIQKVAKQGLKVIEIQISLKDIVNTFYKSQPSGRELSQFYRTIGKRLENGRGVRQTIEESLEFTLDDNLKVMASMMLLAAANAATIDECMAFAGFPERDCAIVKSLRLAGSAYKAFESLSAYYSRDYNLRRMIRGVFIEPSIVLVLGYIFVWGVFVFAIPKIEHLFKVLPDSKLPKNIEYLYHLVNIFDAHIVVSTILYIAIIPAGFLFFRSPLFKRMIDMVGSIRNLSERSDHAIIWSSYALLYEAAWNRADAAEMISRSATRRDSQIALQEMAIAMRRAITPARAVTLSGFPKFVKSAVANILGSGSADDIVEGLINFSETLQDDVTVLSERVAVVLKNTTIVVFGLFVTGIISITVLPVILSAISMA
ncbi:hypothetical protein HAQ00_02310 [Acidithiobacillus caldus ATCC 51756]|jgi:type II secretory pathway component PulF|uniref:type II secretion system F family protein n=1 Tax=Acidithiobacillus caldus TaxID=33059 RepID=UPI001C075586|nr:type II secretion system F family protein [Acidithiobacillus caldus]MBU2734578.1 hypothetical protein [Acidithiobacillus caldus ATCC 51756]MBU2801323.1 hypothetical protein [Acidithiobacillus caldus]